MDLYNLRPPVRPMPEMPVLDPWIPLATLAEYLEQPADHPLIHRAMEHLPLQHFNEADRSVSALAAVWLTMQVDPRCAVQLMIILKAATSDPDRFQYAPTYHQEQAE